MCFVELGENCYVIKNLYGMKDAIPYGASMETWVWKCEALLGDAMKNL